MEPIIPALPVAHSLRPVQLVLGLDLGPRKPRVHCRLIARASSPASAYGRGSADGCMRAVLGLPRFRGHLPLAVMSRRKESEPS